MKICDKCGLELSVFKIVKEVVNGVENEKTVYTCRNKNCINNKKEIIISGKKDENE